MKPRISSKAFQKRRQLRLAANEPTPLGSATRPFINGRSRSTKKRRANQRNKELTPDVNATAKELKEVALRFAKKDAPSEDLRRGVRGFWEDSMIVIQKPSMNESPDAWIEQTTDPETEETTDSVIDGTDLSSTDETHPLLDETTDPLIAEATGFFMDETTDPAINETTDQVAFESFFPTVHGFREDTVWLDGISFSNAEVGPAEKRLRGRNGVSIATPHAEGVHESVVGSVEVSEKPTPIVKKGKRGYRETIPEKGKGSRVRRLYAIRFNKGECSIGHKRNIRVMPSCDKFKESVKQFHSEGGGASFAACAVMVNASKEKHAYLYAKAHVMILSKALGISKDAVLQVFEWVCRPGLRSGHKPDFQTSEESLLSMEKQGNNNVNIWHNYQAAVAEVIATTVSPFLEEMGKHIKTRSKDAAGDIEKLSKLFERQVKKYVEYFKLSFELVYSCFRQEEPNAIFDIMDRWFGGQVGKAFTSWGDALGTMHRSVCDVKRLYDKKACQNPARGCRDYDIWKKLCNEIKTKQFMGQEAPFMERDDFETKIKILKSVKCAGSGLENFRRCQYHVTVNLKDKFKDRKDPYISSWDILAIFGLVAEKLSSTATQDIPSTESKSSATSYPQLPNVGSADDQVAAGHEAIKTNALFKTLRDSEGEPSKADPPQTHVDATQLLRMYKDCQETLSGGTSTQSCSAFHREATTLSVSESSASQELSPFEYLSSEKNRTSILQAARQVGTPDGVLEWIGRLLILGAAIMGIMKIGGGLEAVFQVVWKWMNTVQPTTSNTSKQGLDSQRDYISNPREAVNKDLEGDFVLATDEEVAHLAPTLVIFTDPQVSTMPRVIYVALSSADVYYAQDLHKHEHLVDSRHNLPSMDYWQKECGLQVLDINLSVKSQHFPEFGIERVFCNEDLKAKLCAILNHIGPGVLMQCLAALGDYEPSRDGKGKERNQGAFSGRVTAGNGSNQTYDRTKVNGAAIVATPTPDCKISKLLRSKAPVVASNVESLKMYFAGIVDFTQEAVDGIREKYGFPRIYNNHWRNSLFSYWKSALGVVKCRAECCTFFFLALFLGDKVFPHKDKENCTGQGYNQTCCTSFHVKSKTSGRVYRIVANLNSRRSCGLAFEKEKAVIKDMMPVFWGALDLITSDYQKKMGDSNQNVTAYTFHELVLDAKVTWKPHSYNLQRYGSISFKTVECATAPSRDYFLSLPASAIYKMREKFEEVADKQVLYRVAIKMLTIALWFSSYQQYYETFMVLLRCEDNIENLESRFLETYSKYSKLLGFKNDMGGKRNRCVPGNITVEKLQREHNETVKQLLTSKTSRWEASFSAVEEYLNLVNGDSYRDASRGLQEKVIDKVCAQIHGVSNFRFMGLAQIAVLVGLIKPESHHVADQVYISKTINGGSYETMEKHKIPPHSMRNALKNISQKLGFGERESIAENLCCEGWRGRKRLDIFYEGMYLFHLFFDKTTGRYQPKYKHGNSDIWMDITHFALD